LAISCAHFRPAHRILGASNILLPYSPDEVRNKPRKRLSDACDAYDLEGWKGIDKDAIAERIGNGTWREYHSPEEVLDYNEEDVRMELRLLRAQLLGRPGLLPASVPHVLHWSNYSAKRIALIQARGMPIDMVLWHLVQENNAAIIGELLRRFDPSYGSDDPIFSPEGKFSYRRFEHWLVRTGVTTWPRLPSGQLDLDGDAFRLMSYVPGVEVVHALRDSLNFIRRELPIGTDGRNRPSLFPFGTMRIGTASTMPMPACVPSWCFRRALSAPIWIGAPKRLALPLPCPAILHCWPTMPPAISIMHWHECAGSPMTRIRCIGSRINRAQRDRMKPLQLGINYGMGVPSLARGLDRHPLIASEIIERHKRRYPVFWQWHADVVRAAMLNRRIESVFGWPLHLSTSPNQRTLYNFPMQAGGAEMLRLATMRLCDAGIIPIMLIHDGILLEETDPEKIEHAKEIMRGAGRDTCNGLEIGVDVDQLLENGARYRDKRPMAQQMWATMMDVLQAIGAVPVQAVA